jgi:hypothetical protein
MADDRLPHATPDIMPIHRLIQSTRFLLRSSWVATGTGLTVGLGLGILVVVAAIDVVFPLWEWFRLAALLLVAVPAGYALLVGVLLPLVRRLAAGDVARRIETHLPGIHNRLVSCIDLSTNHQPGYSPAFYRKLVTEALERIRGFAPSRVVDSQSLRRAAAFATVSVLIFGTTWALLSERMSTAMARVFAPFADIPPASDVSYKVQPGDAKVLRGEEVPFEVQVTRGEPKELRIELYSDQAPKPLKYDLKADRNGLWKLTIDSSSIGEGFENGFSYRVFGGGTWSRKHSVMMVDRPVLASLQTVLHYPKYMQIPEPRVGTLQTANVTGPEASEVEVLVQAEGDVKNAEVQIVDRVWFEDRLPAGAHADGIWQWDRKFNGKIAHTEQAAIGTHQHWFQAASAGFTVQPGESLISYVFLVPDQLPQAIMLQWQLDGDDWEHRAYWGADVIKLYGHGDTPGHRHMGPLPQAGGWVRLEVPAATVGVVGKTLRGMGFVLAGGQAYWSKAGAAPTLGKKSFAMTALGDNHWSGRFPLLRNGNYRVELRNELGHPNKTMQDATFEATPDLPPQVMAIKPGRDVVLGEDRKVALEILAIDDYGLAEITLGVRRGDFGDYEKRTLARYTGPRKLRDGDPRDDRKVAHIFDLAPYKLNPGDVLRYVIEARDRKGQVTRTPEYTVRIATDATSGDDRQLAAFEKTQDPFYEKLLKLIAEQAKIRAEIERITAKYANLDEKIKEAEAQAAKDTKDPKLVNPKGPSDPKDPPPAPKLDPETAKMLDALRQELANLSKQEQANVEAGKQLAGDLAKSAEQAENLPLMPRDVANEMKALENAFRKAALQPLENLMNQMQQGADPKAGAPDVGDLKRQGERVQRDLEAMRDRMKALADIRKDLRKDELDKVLDRMKDEMMRQNARLNANELEELLRDLHAMREQLAKMRSQENDLMNETAKAPNFALPSLEKEQDDLDKFFAKTKDDIRALQTKERMKRMKRKKDFPDAPYTPEGEEKKERPSEQDTDEPLPGKDKKDKDKKTGDADPSNKTNGAEEKKKDEEEDFKPVLAGPRTKMDERFKDKVRPVERKPKDGDKGEKGDPIKLDPKERRDDLRARQNERSDEMNRADDSLAADEDALSQMINQLQSAMKGGQKGQKGQKSQKGQKGQEGQESQEGSDSGEQSLAQMMQSQMMQQAMAMAQRMRQMRGQQGQQGQRGQQQANSQNASTGNLSGGQGPTVGSIKEEDLAKLTLDQRSVIMKLQPALREELLRGMKEDVPEGYRKFTQEYFKRLTEVQKAKP